MVYVMMNKDYRNERSHFKKDDVYRMVAVEGNYVKLRDDESKETKVPKEYIYKYEDEIEEFLKRESKVLLKVNEARCGLSITDSYRILNLSEDEQLFVIQTSSGVVEVPVEFVKDPEETIALYKGSVSPAEEGTGPSDGWGYVADRSGVDRKVVKGYLSDLASGRHSVLELAVNYNLEPAKMGHINDLFREWMSNEL